MHISHFIVYLHRCTNNNKTTNHNVLSSLFCANILKFTKENCDFC